MQFKTLDICTHISSLPPPPLLYHASLLCIFNSEGGCCPALPCRVWSIWAELSWAYCFANMCTTYSMLHVSIACNANGNCNGNGYGKCCHIASQYPFSPCVCGFLFFATHFYNGIYIFFAFCCCCCCVCVFMFYTSNCCLMCCSPSHKTSSSRVAQPWGRGNGGSARWSQVRIILQTFKNQFQHNTLDKYECKKAATLLLHSLSAFLFLLPPLEGFGLICEALRRLLWQSVGCPRQLTLPSQGWHPLRPWCYFFTTCQAVH